MRRTMAELCARFADVSVDEMASFAEACERQRGREQAMALSKPIAITGRQIDGRGCLGMLRDTFEKPP
jgi:hypothetical protein